MSTCYSDRGSRIGALVATVLSLPMLLDAGALAFSPSSSVSLPVRAAVAASVSLTFAPPPLYPRAALPLSMRNTRPIPRLKVVLAASPLPTDQQQPDALITAATTTITDDKEPAAAISSKFSSPLLGIVDIVMLLVFAATGRASHVDGSSLDVVATLYTAAPFIVAWFLTAPWTKVYQENAPDNLLDASYQDVAVAAATQTLRGWAVAMPLGCVLRGIVKGYVPPLPFVMVTLVATLVLLTAARVVYAVTARYLEQSSTTSSSSSIN
jgi:Protein of unknown function (DUF3054)